MIKEIVIGALILGVFAVQANRSMKPAGKTATKTGLEPITLENAHNLALKSRTLETTYKGVVPVLHNFKEDGVLSANEKVMSVTAALLGRTIESTNLHEAVAGLVMRSQNILNNLNGWTPKASKKALKFLKVFNGQNGHLPFLKSVNNALLETGLATAANLAQKRHELAVSCR